MDIKQLGKQEVDFHDFIGRETDVIVHLHNTSSLENALNIIEEGFRFAVNLNYTTDMVSQTIPEEIDYFIVKRKFYGTFTIVIHLGIDLMNQYLDRLRADGIHEQKEVIFSVLSNEKNDDDHHFHILHRQFIKGFYDQKTKTGYTSPFYAPHDDLPAFKECLKHLQHKHRKK